MVVVAVKGAPIVLIVVPLCSHSRRSHVQHVLWLRKLPWLAIRLREMRNCP